MDELKKKTILILSPQVWGNMFLSKHHYAVELSRKNNEVYFLNPPDNHKINLSGKRKRISINVVQSFPRLHIIQHQLFFPYNLKFHAKAIFDFFMKKQVRDILKEIGKPVDIVWSFDLGNLYHFSFFDKKSIKIFHPVDEPLDKDAIASANGSDMIFSITSEILRKYQVFKIPSFFVSHGVSEDFFNYSAIEKPDNKIHVGLSGNFLRPDIDREILLEIIRQNQDIIFDFFGTYELAQSNIGGSSDGETNAFISSLKKISNVVLHGVLKKDELALALNRMDAFLICYDVKKDQSKGTNYHKIMEYLGTGKVIISNNVSTYKEMPHLVRMVASRENNHELPELFKGTINCLSKFNSPDLTQKRIDFAKENTYSKQIERIEKILKSA